MKKIIKRTVLWTLGSLCRDCGGKVIFYHDICPGRCYSRMATTLDMFKRHVDVARVMGYQFVREIPRRDRELLLCLDDGFRGIYEAKNYFVDNRILPIVSIAVELIGQEGYLTWAEVEELQAAGFGFISHTWSHRSLTEVPADELHHELAASRSFISKKLGRDVKQLCFPRGLYSRKVIHAALSAGYDTFFTSLPGSTRFQLPRSLQLTDCLIVPRNLVQFANADEFKSVLRGAYIPIRWKYIGKHFKK